MNSNKPTRTHTQQRTLSRLFHACFTPGFKVVFSSCCINTCHHRSKSTWSTWWSTLALIVHSHYFPFAASCFPPNHLMFFSRTHILSLLLQSSTARSSTHSIPLPVLFSSILPQQQAHSYSRASRLTKTFQRAVTAPRIPSDVASSPVENDHLTTSKSQALQRVLNHEALVVTRAIEWWVNVLGRKNADWYRLHHTTHNQGYRIVGL